MHDLPFSPEQSRGRTLLAALVGGWLLLDLVALLYVALTRESSWVLVGFLRLGLTLGVFCLVWQGHRWARWLIVGMFAMAALISANRLISAASVFLIILSTPLTGIFVALGGLLAFSKSIREFLEYQRAKNLPGTVRLSITGIALIIFGAAVAIGFYLHSRNVWPESFRDQLAQLKASGAALTLADCDKRYRALGSDPNAVKHFQRAFAAISKEKPALMPPRMPFEKRRPRIPDFSEISKPDEQKEVVACLQNNAEAVRLLHETAKYDRCHFPMELTNGFQTLLPHLYPCSESAHLLVLEAVEKMYQGDTNAAAASLLASLHIAEILTDEPLLVGMVFRDKILASVCESTRACMNMAPLSKIDLEQISRRLQGAIEMGDRPGFRAMAYERCVGMSIFQGSNQQIADFLDQGPGRFTVKLGVEFMRAKGMLQRDAAFFLDQSSRMESALASDSCEEISAELDEVAAQVEQNQRLIKQDKTKINLISCMLLPGAIHGFQNHLWTHMYGEATITVLAVERYRQKFGHLPADIQDLVPEFLARIPEDLVGKPFVLRTLPKGYAVSGQGRDGSDKDLRRPDPIGSYSEGVVFRIER